VLSKLRTKLTGSPVSAEVKNCRLLKEEYNKETILLLRWALIIILPAAINPDHLRPFQAGDGFMAFQHFLFVAWQPRRSIR
jgi:hypothetical protein